VRGNVADTNVRTGSTGGQRDVRPIVDDDRNRQGHQCARHDEQVARIEVFEAKLDHGRAPANCRGGTRVQPVDTIAQIIRDGDETQTAGNREWRIGRQARGWLVVLAAG